MRTTTSIVVAETANRAPKPPPSLASLSIGYAIGYSAGALHQALGSDMQIVLGALRDAEERAGFRDGFEDAETAR